MRLKGFVLQPAPLPRTPLGKLRRFLIGDLVAEREDPVPETPPPDIEYEDHVVMGVMEALRGISGKEGVIRLDDNLELDIGLDSLKRIELVVELEKTFRVSLPETFGTEVQTVREIIERMNTLPSFINFLNDLYLLKGKFEISNKH